MVEAARRADGIGAVRFGGRHRLRVVRLLHLRLAAVHRLAAFLRQRRRDPRLYLRADDLRGGLFRAAVRRAGVRLFRRPHRAQAHLPVHDSDHGRGDVPDRRPAGHGHHRRCRAVSADRLARAAGLRGRRRVWRRGGLCRRTRGPRQARRGDRLDPSRGDGGAVPGAVRHPRGAHDAGRGRFRGLGLARAVPAVGAAAGDLDLDPAEARRVAGVPRHEGSLARPRARRCRRRSCAGKTCASCWLC